MDCYYEGCIAEIAIEMCLAWYIKYSVTYRCIDVFLENGIWKAGSYSISLNFSTIVHDCVANNALSVT